MEFLVITARSPTIGIGARRRVREERLRALFFGYPGICFGSCQVLRSKPGTRAARWFKRFQEKNRPPYRWYERGTYPIRLSPRRRKSIETFGYGARGFGRRR